MVVFMFGEFCGGWFSLWVGFCFLLVLIIFKLWLIYCDVFFSYEGQWIFCIVVVGWSVFEFLGGFVCVVCVVVLFGGVFSFLG